MRNVRGLAAAGKARAAPRKLRPSADIQRRAPAYGDLIAVVFRQIGKLEPRPCWAKTTLADFHIAIGPAIIAVADQHDLHHRKRPRTVRIDLPFQILAGSRSAAWCAPAPTRKQAHFQVAERTSRKPNSARPAHHCPAGSTGKPSRGETFVHGPGAEISSPLPSSMAGSKLARLADTSRRRPRDHDQRIARQTRPDVEPSSGQAGSRSPVSIWKHVDRGCRARRRGRSAASASGRWTAAPRPPRKRRRARSQGRAGHGEREVPIKRLPQRRLERSG